MSLEQVGTPGALGRAADTTHPGGILIQPAYQGPPLICCAMNGDAFTSRT